MEVDFHGFYCHLNLMQSYLEKHSHIPLRVMRCQSIQ